MSKLDEIKARRSSSDSVAYTYTINRDHISEHENYDYAAAADIDYLLAEVARLTAENAAQQRKIVELTEQLTACNRAVLDML